MAEVQRSRSPEDLLDQFKIRGVIPGKIGRQYALCPMCSDQRSGANKKSKCLAVNFSDEGVRFFCNHCGDDPGGMKGGASYTPRSGGTGAYGSTGNSISQRAMPKRNGYAALHAQSRKHWGSR